MSKTRAGKRSDSRRRGSEGKLQVLRGPRAKRYPLLHVAKPDDVGFDLIAVEDTVVPPGADLSPVEVDVDMRIKLPKGTAAVIWPRSSTHSKYPGLQLCQAPIDGGYVGPIGPRFRNLGSGPVVIPAGEAVAQLVIVPAVVPEVVEVDALPVTERGETRYGSSGD